MRAIFQRDRSKENSRPNGSLMSSFATFGSILLSRLTTRGLRQKEFLDAVVVDIEDEDVAMRVEAETPRLGELVRCRATGVRAACNASKAVRSFAHDTMVEVICDEHEVVAVEYDCRRTIQHHRCWCPSACYRVSVQLTRWEALNPIVP